MLRRAKAERWRNDDPADNAGLQTLPQAPRSSAVLPKGRLRADALANPKWAGVKLVLEFILLTATRSGEVAQAVWNEVDLEAATWTVPAERMKAGKKHRVPLSPRCVAILREAQATPRTSRTADSPLLSHP